MSGRYQKWMRALLWAATAAAAAATVWLCAPASQRAAVTEGPSGQAGRNGSAVLDMNAAGVRELEELPGIGPTLAERIVDYRTEHGPFSGPEGLMDVSGIGPGVWADIQPFVYFGEQ